MKRNLSILFVSILVFALQAQTSSNVEIQDLNTNTFKAKVWNFSKNKNFTRVGNLPIILDFHATWCRPCKMLAPHLQEIQKRYKGKLVVYKIDVDQEPELAKKFRVEAMPTIIFIDDVRSYKTEVGYKEFVEYDKLVKTYFFSKK